MEPSWILKFQLQPTIVLFQFPFYRDRFCFWSIDLESSSLAGAFVNLKVSATADNSPIKVSFYRDRYCFWSIDLESSSLAGAFVEFSFKQLATWTFSLAAILPACYCFVLPALLCCNVIFKVNLLRISLTYYPVRL